MNILVPTGIFHPEAGGPATYLYHLLPEIQQHGHTVEVITFGEGNTENYPYPVIRIPRGNFFKRHWMYFQAVRQRIPYADRVFINSLGLPLPQIKQRTILKVVGDLAWERAINRGWLPPTTDIDEFQTARYHPLINWLKRSRAREAQRRDRIIVPSEYLRQMVIGWGAAPEKVITIYNAFEPPPKVEKLSRAALNLPENVPLLLISARLVAWKGVDAVLEAIVSLPDIHLMIAGDGPMLDPWQQMAADLGLDQRVKFLGHIPHDQLGHYYVVADYVVLYSGYEGLSHVILEALYAGTPVIASQKCGNPEVIIDGKNGFLVPYRDVDALRDSLRRAFEGDTPRRLRDGATLDLERFRWEKLVQATLSVLES